MTNFHSSLDNVDGKKLAALQQALIERPDQAELLHAYFQEAVAVGELQRARVFLDRLQQEHPWNHLIRRWLIALSLQQKDYPAAMDGVETLVAFSTPDDALIDSALAIRSHLEPRFIDSRSSTPATSISLCMIVKNEQAFLGPCLNSIKRLVDEIIVVDTGSNDRSADIARIYGAQVFNVQWQDDFSSARNVSLDKAHGDWILILDADEIIASQDFAILRQMVLSANEDPKAYSLQTRNYLNLANAVDWQPNDSSYPQQEAGIGWFPTDKVRLFPNLPQIRFDYPVHEMVDNRIKAAGIPILAGAIPIHHYGHLNEKKNRLKAERYFKLGYAKLDQLGNDRVALRELAVQAGQLKRWQEAIEMWNRLLGISPGHIEAYVNMSGACWQMGHYEKGAAYAKKAIASAPHVKEGHYNLSVNLLMKGQPEKTVEILQRLLQKHNEYPAGRFMLAAALCVIGEGKRGQLIFSDLDNAMPGRVLAMAIDDLVQKFDAEGLSRYGDRVRKAVVGKK